MRRSLRAIAIRPLAAGLLLIAGCMPAFAAPPTDAQVDRLLATLEIPQLLDQMVEQMAQGAAVGGERALGPDATPAQRAELQRMLQRQQDMMHSLLGWDKLQPVYRRVYAQTFTAEEIDAMIAFYSSDTGRSIRRKLPEAMALASEQMRPQLEAAIDRMRRELERAPAADAPVAP